MLFRSGEILPILALFTVGTFRILPSITRTVEMIHQIRFASAIVDQTKDYMSLDTKDQPEVGDCIVSPFESLELSDAFFAYEGDSAFQLGPLSMRIERGEYVGLVGESGAGKSTLVDLIAGLLHVSRGSVSVNDQDLVGRERAWRQIIGYVPQSIYLTDESIRRNVAFGIRDRDIDDSRVAHAIALAQLTEFVDQQPAGLETQVGERGIRLSGGQRQRIGIARALYHRPEILLLDEATAALDMETERGVMDAVHTLRGSMTVIIIAHRLATVERCDRLYHLEKGKVDRKSTRLIQSH